MNSDPSHGNFVSAAGKSARRMVGRNRKNRRHYNSLNSIGKNKFFGSNKLPLTGNLYKIQLYSIAAFFGISFTVVLIGSISLAFHNSHIFKRSLINEIGKASNTTVRMKKISVSPSLATAWNIELLWKNENFFLSKLSFNKLNFHYLIGGLLGGSWSGSDLEANSGELVLGQGLSNINIESGEYGISDNYKVERIRCSDLDVYSANGIKLVDNCMAYIGWKNSYLEINLINGKFSHKELGTYTIEEGNINLSPNVNSISFNMLDENGEGKVQIHKKLGESKDNSFTFGLDNMPSNAVLGSTFSKIIDAGWNGDGGELNFSDDGKLSTEYSIDLSSTSVSLGHLDCFNILSEVLGKNSYRMPQLKNGGKLEIQKSANGYTINKLSLESNFGMAIKGSLFEKKGKISGKLYIGIEAGSKKRLDKYFKNDAFAIEGGGYLWQNVMLDGTIKDLKDDLVTKLKSTNLRNSSKINEQRIKKSAESEAVTTEIEDAFEKLISE